MEKRLKVLAVSPHFAPSNAADSHRLRLLLRHAASNGWDVEVLAVSAEDVLIPRDEWLEKRLPPLVAVHRVRIWQPIALLFNSLALRALLPLYWRGKKLLTSGGFDLVFFSTTEFLVHLLGPCWQRKYGVPFCMDFQDPWVNTYYDDHPEVPKPGGAFKYAAMQWLDNHAERYVVAACGGFLSVSAAYIADLKRRYPVAMIGKPVLVRGFPGEPLEFDADTGTGPPAPRGGAVWRYIGRGGADLGKAASAFFLAWQQALALGLVAVDSVRFEALGTSYAGANRATATIAPLVAGTVLQASVIEVTDRLPYGGVLEKLVQSDALVVFGSDDPAYTASKLYPYLLARRPLLVILHQESPAVPFLHAVGGAVCVTFDTTTSIAGLAEAIYRQWFASGQHAKVQVLDLAEFEPYTAPAQARAIGHWFREVVDFDKTAKATT